MPLAVLLAVGVALTPPSGSLEQTLALLDGLDARTITVRYVGADLDDVLLDLDGRLPISLRADWEALDRLGVGPTDEIDLALDAVPASTVLAAIAAQLGDEFERPVVESHAGQVVLTTIVGSAAMRQTDVYDVRDLLTDGATVRELRATRPLPVVGPVLEAGDGQDVAATPAPAPDAAPPPRTPRTPGEELMLLIAEHVDPEAWMDFGGARARIDERDGVLFVTAPPSVHRMFRDALARLRRTSPSALAIECTIADIPRDTYDSMLRRNDATSVALGRALLLAPGGIVRWRATNAVALGESITADATHGAVHVRLELATRLDRERGIVGLDVALETAEGDDRRSLRTTVRVPAKLGGAVLELPSAALGDTVRVLVLAPQRR